jgi:hypothetical protein
MRPKNEERRDTKKMSKSAIARALEESRRGDPHDTIPAPPPSAAMAIARGDDRPTA